MLAYGIAAAVERLCERNPELVHQVSDRAGRVLRRQSRLRTAARCPGHPDEAEGHHPRPDVRRPPGIVHARQGDAKARDARRAAAAERLRPGLHREERGAVGGRHRLAPVPRARGHAKIPEVQNLFKYAGEIGVPVHELTAYGWILASELYSGLVDAGPHFSQAAVIDALNRQTALGDNGLIAPVDWTKGHIDTEKDASSARPRGVQRLGDRQGRQVRAVREHTRQAVDVLQAQRPDRRPPRGRELRLVGAPTANGSPGPQRPVLRNHQPSPRRRATCRTRAFRVALGAVLPGQHLEVAGRPRGLVQPR